MKRSLTVCGAVLWTAIGLGGCGDGGTAPQASAGSANGGGTANGGGASAAGSNSGRAGQSSAGGQAAGGSTAGAGPAGSNSGGGSTAASGGGGTNAGGSGGASGGTAPSGGAPSNGGRGGATSGGSAGAGGSGGGGGGTSTSSCTMTGAWPTRDPAVAGPYQVTTEMNVGPMAGVANDDGEIKRFNVYRPMTLGMDGVCHPIVMWNNGHGDRPATYEVLLKQLASHGFVVVATLSSNTSKGTPRPAIAGIDWIIAQSNDSSSPFYHHLDTAHIGITGHSEGAFATVDEGSDPRVSTVASICGAAENVTLHGPALLTCGGMDTVAKCSGVQADFESLKNVPVMFANNLASDHGSWLFQNGIKGPTIIAVTGWMRVHLMGDTALRPMFYGPDCKLCTDSQHWSVMRKMMDQ